MESDFAGRGANLCGRDSRRETRLDLSLELDMRAGSRLKNRKRTALRLYRVEVKRGRKENIEDCCADSLRIGSTIILLAKYVVRSSASLRVSSSEALRSKNYMQSRPFTFKLSQTVPSL
jgi:hypothetical protein